MKGICNAQPEIPQPVAGIPPGTIMAYAGATTPNGWIDCAGTALLKSQYPGLYAAIGTTYGETGNGQYFLVPNLSKRMIYGSFASSDRNKTGGSETVSLAIANMPSHTHTVTVSRSGAHYHTITVTSPNGSAGNRPCGSSSTVSSSTSPGTSTTGAHEHTATATNSGGGTAHNNMPPYMYMKWIIKT